MNRTLTLLNRVDSIFDEIEKRNTTTVAKDVSEHNVKLTHGDIAMILSAFSCVSHYHGLDKEMNVLWNKLESYIAHDNE